ncbi:hypothetical protein AVEN_91959-1, partial [Araneus ventricosus]
MSQRASGLIHDGSWLELCFEPGTLRIRGRHLTTRPHWTPEFKLTHY